MAHLIKDLLCIRRDQKVLNHLGTFLFGYLVDMPEEGKKGIEVKKLQDAFTVLIDALDDNLVDLGVALAQITCLICAFIHTLDYSLKILLRLNL